MYYYDVRGRESDGALSSLGCKAIKGFDGSAALLSDEIDLPLESMTIPDMPS